MIDFRTGNLGVERLRAARCGEPLPDPEIERAQLAAWRAQGFDAVEDYVFWELVEPQRGRFDWSLHRGNAVAAHRAGLKYVVYPWAHAVPAWFRASQDFVPGRCVEHGEPGPMPSPFAATTGRAAERWLRELRAGLGDSIDGLAAAFPADYGEAGFLSGVAGWLLGEGSHHHTGLWCDEREARRSFAAQVRDRHGTPGRLGAAWGLEAERAWEHCPYPADLLHPRDDSRPRWPPGSVPTLLHRLDFARFYQGAVTDLTRRLLELLAELFPAATREVKLGHCSETLELGTDWHALVAAAAATGSTVRFTGGGMGELFTKRVASLCRSHGVPFATEGPREIPQRYVIERVFTELAAGTTSVFEYPEQMEVLRAPLEAVRPALGRRPVRPAVALFYPTTDLALQPGHGAPSVVAHCFDAFRRTCDLELLDERQVAAGALTGLRALVWLEGGDVPVATLLALQRWIEGGGVLIAAAAEAPRPIDTTGHLDAAAAVALGAPMIEQLAPVATSALGYSLAQPPEAFVVHPGEIEARLLLGAGWHGRENGTWAWPLDGAAPAGPLSASAQAELHAAGALELNVPCRWSGARAAAYLLRPAAMAAATGGAPSSPGAAQLVIDAFVPPQAPPGPARVYVDGALLAEVGGGGTRRWCVPLARRGGRSLQPAEGDVLRVELEVDTHRPRPTGDSGSASDARELGVLVRRIALLGDAPADPQRATSAAALAGLRCDPRAARRVGQGWVLPGDGSPLSALAWLSTWIDGSIDGLPALQAARDPGGRLLVSELEGGRLEHEPGSQETRWRTP